MAMKLLEKDIHEKQDTIVSLRRQLEDIKQINLEMYRKLQVNTVFDFNSNSITILPFDHLCFGFNLVVVALVVSYFL